MLEAPELMRMAQDLARHAGARQSQIARNIANADTPGYRARDLESFADVMRPGPGAIGLRQSRPLHLPPGGQDGPYRTMPVPGRPSPNGNTVSLEDEMVRATRAKSDHTLALTVYSSSMNILRTAMGRGR